MTTMMRLAHPNLVLDFGWLASFCTVTSSFPSLFFSLFCRNFAITTRTHINRELTFSLFLLVACPCRSTESRRTHSGKPTTRCINRRITVNNNNNTNSATPGKCKSFNDSSKNLDPSLKLCHSGTTQQRCSS